MLQVLDVFARIDENGNGELDADEFRIAMQVLGLDLPRSQTLKVLDEFDEDGDGTVSPAACAACPSHRTRGRLTRAVAANRSTSRNS